MTNEQLLKALEAKEIKFADVLAHIENQYKYSPSAFKNGSIENKEHENQGSAKVLYFAKISGFTKHQTLLLFAEHYDAVLNDPNGEAHQNIRQFIKHDWNGVAFKNVVLTKK